MRRQVPWRRIGTFAIPAVMVAVAIATVLAFPKDGSSSATRTFATRAPSSVPVRLKVYVTGAVQQPGVYTVSEGDRIEDVLRLAGGPAVDADLEAVNLASRVRDAQQIIIPRQGEVTGGEGAPPGAPINVNTASKAVLETLPDIGPARAQRIIDSRNQDGPFREPRDLVTRKIISERILSKLSDRLTVQ